VKGLWSQTLPVVLSPDYLSWTGQAQLLTKQLTCSSNSSCQLCSTVSWYMLGTEETFLRSIPCIKNGK